MQVCKFACHSNVSRGIWVYPPPQTIFPEWDAGSHDRHSIRENFALSVFFVRLKPSQFYDKLFTLTLKVGRISPSESDVFSSIQRACLY